MKLHYQYIGGENMKKIFKKISVVLALGICMLMLFTMTACGGARGVLGSYIHAVKAGDMTKAATYVEGNENPGDQEETSASDDEISQYIWEKTIGSFAYEVKETTEEKDENGEVVSTKIVISYEKYSYTELKLKLFGASLIVGGETTKTDVDAALEKIQKKYDTATVKIVKIDKDWKISKGSASELYLAMTV